MFLIRYLTALTNGKIVLWCYLIWYLTNVYFRFDPSPRLWLNSVGISAVIGTGLLLSVARPAGGKADRWQTFRLYCMPFCVSSFSALIKGYGYILIFSSSLSELACGVAACAGFVALVLIMRRLGSADADKGP